MKKLRPWLFAAISGFLAICAISVALEATEDAWANWVVAGALVLLTVWLIRKACCACKIRGCEKPNTMAVEAASANPQSKAAWLKDKAECAPTQTEPIFATLSFKVKGTSFDSDGVSRQTYLQKIRFKERPFEDDVLNEKLVLTTFKGEPAIECRVNGCLIGHVPKEMVQEVSAIISMPDTSVSFEVTGGGTKANGEPLNYGAIAKLRFKRGESREHVENFSRGSGMRKVATANVPKHSNFEGETVYVAGEGGKYHADKLCHYVNNDEVIASNASAAKRKGYQPCKKCYPYSD